MSTPMHSFPTTDWSLLARARSPVPLDRTASMEQVISQYVPAVRRYLVRVRRLSAERVEEVIQGFVADKLLTRSLLEHADRDRGRFRNLLVRALENYLVDLHRRERAHQPAQGRRLLALPEGGGGDAMLGEAVVDRRVPDPGAAFDVEWAKAVLTEAVARMHKYCQNRGRDDLWQAFQSRILAPAADGVAPLAYRELAERLKLTSSVEAARLLFSAKRIFIRKLHQVLLDQAGAGAEPSAELAELKKILMHSAQTVAHHA
jgi:hypothetical protein